MDRHRGRVALVTGSAGGLGSAIAERLSREGAIVALVDRVPEEELPARGAAPAAGPAADDAIRGERRYFRCDLADPEQIDALARDVTAWSGRCDVLVNNAGIFPTTPFESIDAREWRDVMAVNLDAPFLLARAFAPGMASRRWGRIVNVASASVGIVRRETCAYIASKMGLVGLTRALASDLGPKGVTVNAVAPGLMRTPATLAKFTAAGQAAIFDHFVARQAIPQPLASDDVAGAVSFLASDDAAMITGQTLVVDGGLVRSAI